MEPAQAQRRGVGEQGEQQPGAQWAPPPVAAQRVSAEHRARFRAQFRKSELCRFYPTLCKRGDECSFAHSPEELHRAPDLAKTSICRAWTAGRCRMDPSECSFAHGYADLRVTTLFLKSAPCKLFLQRGRCDLGSSCRHAHSFAELRSAQSLMDRQTSCARGLAQTSRPEQDPRAERLRNPRGVPSGLAAPPQHLGDIAKPIQWQGRLHDAAPSVSFEGRHVRDGDQLVPAAFAICSSAASEGGGDPAGCPSDGTLASTASSLPQWEAGVKNGRGAEELSALQAESWAPEVADAPPGPGRQGLAPEPAPVLSARGDLGDVLRRFSLPHGSGGLAAAPITLSF